MAALGAAQISEMGHLQAGGSMRGFALAAQHLNLYVQAHGLDLLVAIGESDDKPANTAARLRAAMPTAHVPARD